MDCRLYRYKDYLFDNKTQTQCCKPHVAYAQKVGPEIIATVCGWVLKHFAESLYEGHFFCCSWLRGEPLCKDINPPARASNVDFEQLKRVPLP